MSNVGAPFETARGMQRCRARLVLVTCDLPARAMLLCMKNFNGIAACCHCYHPGMTIGDDHLHRYWPYDGTLERRTHESMKQDVITATATNSAVRIGFCFFSIRCYFMQYFAVSWYASCGFFLSSSSGFQHG